MTCARREPVLRFWKSGGCGFFRGTRENSRDLKSKDLEGGLVTLRNSEFRIQNSELVAHSNNPTTPVRFDRRRFEPGDLA